MKEMVAAGILFLIAIGAFILSIRSFQEKGFLFNNAYLYASKKERSQMDKSPHYRQTAVVFLLISIVFARNAVEGLLDSGWLLWVGIFFIVLTIIYAIASSIQIERKQQ